MIARRPPRELAPNATLVARERLTPDVHVLHVRPDEGLPLMRAGQYITLGLRRGDGWLQRPYSPASASRSGTSIELLIRLVAGGALTPLLWRARAGARLHVGPPKGLFRLLPADQRDHLFLATGTGVAPIVAMVAELLERPEPPGIVIVHGVRLRDELSFRDRITHWIDRGAPIRYLPAASRAAADEGDVAAGRAVDLLPDAWDRLGLRPASTVAYLCGNPAVVESASTFLGGRGLGADAIRLEAYWPAARPAALRAPFPQTTGGFAQHMG